MHVHMYNAGYEPIRSDRVYVIDIAWQGVLYGLHSHEPEGRSPEGEGLYKPDSTNLPCYMCYISVTSRITRAKIQVSNSK